ncbi:opsin-2-like, partial [Diaphorina citri]|uniref:Opsin-2-like n=1 Tax=Diaphorina citri TaxID=121845 RepID=A0A1S3DNB7_DIACI
VDLNRCWDIYGLFGSISGFGSAMNNAVIAYDRYRLDKEKSAEIRIAKVAILIFCLFLISWTPYATIALTGCFGNRNVITPMFGMLPAVAAKIVSCIDPW